MSKDWAGDYYEEKFEFPLWKLIKERAEEKDISYLKAAEEVAPEFAKGVRIRDTEFEDEVKDNKEKLQSLFFTRIIYLILFMKRLNVNRH